MNIRTLLRPICWLFGHGFRDFAIQVQRCRVCGVRSFTGAMFTREALRHLHANLKFDSAFARNYDEQFPTAQAGAAMRIRMKA